MCDAQERGSDCGLPRLGGGVVLIDNCGVAKVREGIGIDRGPRAKATGLISKDTPLLISPVPLGRGEFPTSYKIIFATAQRSIINCRLPALAFHFFHFFAEGEGAHIGPDFFDVGKAFGFESAFACIVPA
jgi:hypothetical protein